MPTIAKTELDEKTVLRACHEVAAVLANGGQVTANEAAALRDCVAELRGMDTASNASKAIVTQLAKGDLR